MSTLSRSDRRRALSPGVHRRPVRASRVCVAFALAAGMLAAGGCASSPRAAAVPDLGRSGVTTQSVQGVGGAMANVSLVDNVDAKSAILDLAPDKAFAALEAAYLALGIPVTDRDVAKRQVGNQAYRVRRKVGDVPMTKVVDCGGDSGMPNAETYQITLTVMSQISPNDAGGSVLQTVVEGQGKNPLTSATSQVRCSSAGGLEERILKAVRGK